MKLKNLLFLFGILLFINCSSDDGPSLSSDNRILSFILEYNDLSYVGKINNTTKIISLETVGLEQFNSIAPKIEIPDKATIFPDPNTPQNFNETVEYIVTAESGEKAIYKVNAVNKPYSVEKDILSFSFNIDGEVFQGEIDQDKQEIKVYTYKDITNLSPDITLSEFAEISPSANDKIDFSRPVEYTVTAQDGSTKVYTVTVYKQEIKISAKSFFIRATFYAQVHHLDISKGEYELFLENDKNSYKLNYFDLEIEVSEDSGEAFSIFYFTFSENIVTANDYKLRFKIDGKVKVETADEIDVLAENAPKIISSDKTAYYYTDTLILKGENLVSGLIIPANGYIYIYDKRYVIVNDDKTEIKMRLDINRGMFPSWLGQPSPRPTRINTYIDGRYGHSIVVDFK